MCTVHVSINYLESRLLLCREEEVTEPSTGNRYRRQQRRGYPPVTPNACAKDAVVSQLFDQAWGDVSSFYHRAVHLIVALHFLYLFPKIKTRQFPMFFLFDITSFVHNTNNVITKTIITN